jgi:hypothetical protein
VAGELCRLKRSCMSEASAAAWSRGRGAVLRWHVVALWARSQPGLSSGNCMRCFKRRAGSGFVRLARAPASARRYGRSRAGPIKGRRGQFFLFLNRLLRAADGMTHTCKQHL